MKNFYVNDWILYEEQITSDVVKPGAHDIYPGKMGDLYNYQIDRVWRITKVHPDGWIDAKGPQGDLHHVSPDDKRLKKASWLRRNISRFKTRRKSVIWKR